MRYEALSIENAKLRGLSNALPPVAEKWLVAEVVHVDLDSLRPRVLINRGSNNGVFKAQAVLGDEGLIGQTTHVGPWSAEVILITDPEHAIPVEIERTGLRTIAVGTDNDKGELSLPYLPGNADVKDGDLLLTSGMGGVFPQGYPVARITDVQREAVQPLAQVRAAPLAHINRDREVMLVWFRETHPAAPARDAGGDLPKGDPNAKPLPAPPKPKPVAPPGADPAAGPAPAGGSAAPAAGAARPAAGAPASATPNRPTAGPRQTVPTPAPAAATPGSATSGPATSGAAAPRSAVPPAAAPPATAPPVAAPPAATPAQPPAENRE
jgi:rod shape-determining protein MreC